MTKQRVSINGITRWKEVDTTPKKAAPAVEEAKVVPLRQAIGEVLRDIRQRQGRTLREVSQRARVSLGYLSEVERSRRRRHPSFWRGFARLWRPPCTRCSVRSLTAWLFLRAFMFPILFPPSWPSSTGMITQWLPSKRGSCGRVVHRWVCGPPALCPFCRWGARAGVGFGHCVLVISVIVCHVDGGMRRSA